jgi:hypothetical protein
MPGRLLLWYYAIRFFDLFYAIRLIRLLSSLAGMAGFALVRAWVWVLQLRVTT